MEPAERVPLSALEHWSYCPRQCGLIHLEATFDENVYTLRGRHAHEGAHQEGGTPVGDDVMIVRGMPLWSEELGLTGKADVVEFHGDQPYPVEYKVGRPGPWDHAEIQLAAQAMCLEEMLGVSVRSGAVYYQALRRRREVRVDGRLRSAVRVAAAAVHSLLREDALPTPVNDARCPRCSLLDACVPDVSARPRRLHLLETDMYKGGWS